MVKRKLPTQSTSSNQEIDISLLADSNNSFNESATDEVKEEAKRPVFRNPNYQHLSGAPKKTWRNLKQIIAHEKNLPWPEDSVHYASITSPPSRLPPKKYSDISGLVAKYRDPETKLFYASSAEFATIRTLPSDIITGYLALRRANNPIS